jgi:ubiquinone/menaquinone biosynthesis C-methylase UbiE
VIQDFLLRTLGSTDSTPGYAPQTGLRCEGAVMTSVADVDKLMYECGIQVLHPGGLEKSGQMAQACGVGHGKLVLEVGIGRGTTACYLAPTYGCRLIGVDTSSSMIEAAREKAGEQGVEKHVSFCAADACRLPSENGQFDVVLVECVTTLLDRARAFPELVRVLKPGGRLGDLEMTYQKEPSEEFARKLHQTWGGFTSMTLEGWRKLFEQHGLETVEVNDFSDVLDDFSRQIGGQLGLSGGLKLAWRLMLDSGLRTSMKEYKRIFEHGAGIFGYAYLVGVKR